MHTHTHTHTHTYARTYARMHAHMHARTHAYTHTLLREYFIVIYKYNSLHNIASPKKFDLIF